LRDDCAEEEIIKLIVVILKWN